ncbi:MAG: ABC transporter ATP-binding protein [Chthoniobacterales bacterium]
MAKITLKNALANGQSLEIDDREFAVLTGPLGSGKTAILRMIAGLETPTQGDIFIGDKKVNDLSPADRDVAMVFADDALYPGMSLRQNIAFGLKQRRFSATELTRRVEDAAAAMSIANLLDWKPAEVSPEQRQRASIARSVARQPKVILCDEPLARFGSATRARLRADFRQLRERLNTTIVYATRDAAEAMALGGRVLVLRDGKVEQSGAVAEVYASPANVFVASFLGAPPMNFIEGTLKLERDAWLFRESGEGTIGIRLLQSDFPALKNLSSPAVTLGIRPENLGIHPAAKGDDSPQSFPALVDFVETTGAESTFHLHTGAHAIITRRFGTSQEQPAGRRVRCHFDLSHLHFFDPASKNRVA